MPSPSGSSVPSGPSGSSGPSEVTDAELALGAPKTPWVHDACDDWNDRFGAGTAPGGKIAGGLKSLVNRYGWEAIRPAWQRYLAEKEPDFVSPADFAQKLGLWLGKRVQGKGQQLVERTRNVLGEWLAKREGIDASQ